VAPQPQSFLASEPARFGGGFFFNNRAWHSSLHLQLSLKTNAGSGGMDSDTLQSVRSRYAAAYDAYLECAKRVSQKLQDGMTPTVDEIAAEQGARERLSSARRELIGAINSSMSQ
jgi:predicted Zn-dependent peptidase